TLAPFVSNEVETPVGLGLRFPDGLLDFARCERSWLSFALPAIPQRRRDRVDRQLDALVDARVGLARAVALHQLDLGQVERLDIGQAQPDRRFERRILLQQPRLAGDPQQAVVRALPAVTYRHEDRVMPVDMA